MQYGFAKINPEPAVGGSSLASSSTSAPTSPSGNNDRVSVFLTENNKPITKLVIEKLKSANNNARHLPPTERRKQIIALIRKILHEVVQRSSHKSQGVPTEERILIPRLHLLQRMLQGVGQVQPTQFLSKPRVLGEAIEISDDEDEFTIEPTANAFEEKEAIAARQTNETRGDYLKAAAASSQLQYKTAPNNRIYVKIKSSPEPGGVQCENRSSAGDQINYANTDDSQDDATNDTVIEHQIDNQIVLDEPAEVTVPRGEGDSGGRAMRDFSTPSFANEIDDYEKEPPIDEKYPAYQNDSDLDPSAVFTPVFVDANEATEDDYPSLVATEQERRFAGKTGRCRGPYRKSAKTLLKKKKKKKMKVGSKIATAAAATAMDPAASSFCRPYPILPSWSTVPAIGGGAKAASYENVTAFPIPPGASVFWNAVNAPYTRSPLFGPRKKSSTSSASPANDGNKVFIMSLNEEPVPVPVKVEAVGEEHTTCKLPTSLISFPSFRPTPGALLNDGKPYPCGLEVTAIPSSSGSNFNSDCGVERDTSTPESSQSAVDRSPGGGGDLRLSVRSFASISSFKTKCFSNMDKLLNS